MHIKIGIRYIFAAVLAGAFLIWWLASPRALDGNSTVYDFMSASVERRVDFLMHMCNNGACLNIADWKCGLKNGPERPVEDCFDAATRNAKPWDKLDAIRKICGRQFMIFDGEFGTKAECEQANRVWGQK